MSVHRLAKYQTDDPFTRVPNTAMNSGLSLKALGLLVFMLSKPDGWNFTERGLIAQLKEGRHAMASAMAELVAAGYVNRTSYVEDGLRRWVTEVYDVPCVDNRSAHARVSGASEIEALSNKGRSKNKADEQEGADAPTDRHTDSSLSDTGRELALEQAAPKSTGKAGQTEQADGYYVRRLIADLVASGETVDLDEDRLAENYRRVFQAAVKAGKDQHGVAVGLTVELLARTFDGLPKQANGLVARLVKANGGKRVLDAAVVTVNSPVQTDPKYAADPLGPVKYLAGVVRS